MRRVCSPCVVKFYSFGISVGRTNKELANSCSFDVILTNFLYLGDICFHHANTIDVAG